MQNNYTPSLFDLSPKQELLNQAYLPQISQPKERDHSPLWVPLLYKISTQNQHSKQHTEAAKTLAESTLHCLILLETQVFYTDGSKTAVGHAAWAVYSQTQQSTSRISDNTSIELAAFTAIYHSLNISAANLQHKTIAIHTDSKAAILLLAQRRPVRYTQIITQTRNMANSLQHTGASIAMNLIPIHLGLQGNELADHLATQVTQLPAQQITHSEDTQANTVLQYNNTKKSSLPELATDSRPVWYGTKQPQSINTGYI